MICWNMDTPQAKMDRFIDAVMNKGWLAFAHPDTIAQLRNEDVDGMLTFDITPNEILTQGTVFAIAPLPSIEEQAEQSLRELFERERAKHEAYWKTPFRIRVFH